MSDTLKSVKKWVIALIVLVVILTAFFPLLDSGKEKSLSFLRMVGIIKGETYVDPTKTPENLKISFDSLVNAIRKSNESEKCFIRYKEYSPLGLFQVQIDSVNSEGTDQLYIKLINPEKQVLEFEKISNIKPCVVAGSITITQNFIDNWIDNKAPKNPDYMELKNLKYKLNTQFVNENNIFFNGEQEESEDQGILYKPDKGHICFFATKDGNAGCDADPTRLDDACLKKLDAKIQRNSKLLCGD